VHMAGEISFGHFTISIKCNLDFILFPMILYFPLSGSENSPTLLLFADKEIDSCKVRAAL
jgi:hypothetical protein